MAATGFTPIQLYRTSTASATPSAGNLADGELAINLTDEKLYFKNAGGTVKLLASAAGSSGDVVGPGSATDSALVAFDGTTGKLIKQASTVTVAQGGTGATSLTANNVILGNGTSAVQFVAPGSSGNVLTSNGTTWSSTALPAGGLTYVYKTSNYTTEDKEGVLADTSGGAFTVTLPASPTTGVQVVVADAGGVWGTNNLTVGRNGSTISNVAQDLVCDISGASVQFVYDGTTWEVYAQVGGNGGTAVTLDGVQTLTNKTLTSPVITQNVQVISTNTAAVASGTYVLTASLTLTLPSSPGAGTWVAFTNRSGTTTPVIARNGQNIMGLAEDMTLNLSTAFGCLVFSDATRGWVLV